MEAAKKGKKKGLPFSSDQMSEGRPLEEENRLLLHYLKAGLPISPKVRNEQLKKQIRWLTIYPGGSCKPEW